MNRLMQMFTSLAVLCAFCFVTTIPAKPAAPPEAIVSRKAMDPWNSRSLRATSPE